MTNRIKLLFITWDGPQTAYMESLFMPIFRAIGEKDGRMEFHVLQFTWGDAARIKTTADRARELGVVYNACPIYRKPNVAAGTVFSVINGLRIIRNYIKSNNIDIVMPRSTMPAIMLNRICLKGCKLIFDADGLPIEERVDFSGLRKGGAAYRFLSGEEKKIILKADAVITRSHKAIDIHVQKTGEAQRKKFFCVTNGRDAAAFKPDKQKRILWREKLGIKSGEKVFVYCGSLGEQYCWDEMQAIFSGVLKKRSESRFLILTGQPEFLKGKIDSAVEDRLIIKSALASEVPDCLNVADVAFALRRPTFSMQGVAPIKLSEYLLSGLAVVASRGIGDTEALLRNFDNCLLYDHNDSARIETTVEWCIGAASNRDAVARKAAAYFSVERSAEDYLAAISLLSL
jgi:hypothetical protein